MRIGKHILLFVLMIIILNKLFSQTDTIFLKELEIQSSRTISLYNESARYIQIFTKEEINKAPVQTLQGILEFLTGIDIRQRGDWGVQSDVSIRGGSFEQTLFLLNGVKMNDPQTGHHNMNIPVDVQDIERIEILEGSAARVYGINAFSGAINIITKCNYENKIQLSTVVGEHQLVSNSASLSLANKKTQHYFSLSKKISDGYINNTDFNIYNLFYQNKLRFHKSMIDFQTGYNDKKFGANSFYSAKYPDQFEQTRIFFANLIYKLPFFYNLKIQFYYRRHQDRFELFRNNPPSWYKSHNYHLTQTYGAEVNFNFSTCIGKSAIGAEIRSENILSNILGEPMNDTLDVPFESEGKFTRNHHRENFGLFVEHSYKFSNLNISGGIYYNLNSDFANKINSGIDVSYEFSRCWKWFTSINQSMRLPTFTDLYYVGPTNLGNINLKPENAISYETGIKFYSNSLNAQTSLFRRVGNNLIDWVKLTESDKWESKNITQVISNGIEISSKINLQKIIFNGFFIKNLNLSYTFLNLEKSSENYISYYVLDYLKNKFTTGLEHIIYKHIKADWLISYQDRMGTHTDITTGKETEYSDFWCIDGRVSYIDNEWQCFIEVSNILNMKITDIGNIPLAGRWFRAGININLNIAKKNDKTNNEIIPINY